jgi:hypothetical protein
MLLRTGAEPAKLAERPTLKEARAAEVRYPAAGAIAFAATPAPRWTSENRPLIDRAKPASTERAAETGEFYFEPSSTRKSVWTFVRQLRGPHLRTCA